jgi:hypothetical protein
MSRIARDAQYLYDLEQVLKSQHRANHRGENAPPGRGGMPGGPFEQFPLPPGMDRGGEPSQAPAGEEPSGDGGPIRLPGFTPLPQQQDGPARPAAPRVPRLREGRTFRRIIRNPDTNEIEGIEDAPLP